MHQHAMQVEIMMALEEKFDLQLDEEGMFAEHCVVHPLQQELSILAFLLVHLSI